MPEYIKTPEERKQGMIRRMVARFNRERQLQEQVEDLKRRVRVLQGRVERERNRRLF